MKRYPIPWNCRLFTWEVFHDTRQKFSGKSGGSHPIPHLSSQLHCWLWTTYPLSPDRRILLASHLHQVYRVTSYGSPELLIQNGPKKMLVFWTSHGNHKDGPGDRNGSSCCVSGTGAIATPPQTGSSTIHQRTANVLVDRCRKWCFKSIAISNITPLAVNPNDSAAPGRCCPVSQSWKGGADI